MVGLSEAVSGMMTLSSLLLVRAASGCGRGCGES